MVEILPQSKGRILGITPKGKLTDQDYKQVFIPALEKVVAEHGKVRLLFFPGPDFKGWEPRAMWDDAMAGYKHKKDIEKIATVGASPFLEWASKLASHLMSGEFKNFKADEIGQAWSWLKA